jgi:cell wall-associated NlpC family hydrolase
MLVCATVANLRREPSHASELVSQLVLGEEADALDASGRWVRVAGVDGYAGWANAAALVDAPDAARRPDAGEELVWTRRDGTAFDGPGEEAAPLRDLVLGALVRRADPARTSPARGGPQDGSAARAGARRPVTLPGGEPAWAGTRGWTSRRDLPVRFPREADAVVRTALSLAGVPYLWGGASSKAFDCSGFVQRVFRMHGIELPRDAWQQASVGSAVEAGAAGSGLEAGDLVFFAEGGTRVTHVGIALGRGGRFVHASVRRSGVGVDALDPADPLHEPGLASTVAGCRRVAPAPRPASGAGARV